MLHIKKKRLDISSSFSSYLKALEEQILQYSSYPYGDYYDDYDDYYGDCLPFYDVYGCGSMITERKTSCIDSVCHKSTERIKSNKRGHRGSKRGRCIPLYNDTLCDSDEVTIYFYRDINNPDTKEIFYNLYEFNEFLESEGIFVSKYETKQLMNRSISHCCIDPAFVGIKSEPWLISDSSLGSLVWQVCGSNDDISAYNASMNSEDLPF